jgi:RimJ/RimL family protein N-acetyltransferase
MTMTSPVCPESRATHWRWVPVRSLAPRHRERILAHLLLLDERSRYLRFGYPASDAQIARYVDSIDFQRDEAFGIFNRRLELVAMAHLAYRIDDAPGGPTAEFGVSVLTSARRRGFGGRLFEHAMLHARNRGVQTLIIHALSENAAMLALARRFGATLDRQGPETDAQLRLPPDSFGSHLDQLLGDRAAEIDYSLKWQALHVHHAHRPHGTGPLPEARKADVDTHPTPANQRVEAGASEASVAPR